MPFFFTIVFIRNFVDKWIILSISEISSEDSTLVSGVGVVVSIAAADTFFVRCFLWTRRDVNSNPTFSSCSRRSSVSCFFVPCCFKQIVLVPLFRHQLACRELFIFGRVLWHTTTISVMPVTIHPSFLSPIRKGGPCGYVCIALALQYCSLYQSVLVWWDLDPHAAIIIRVLLLFRSSRRHQQQQQQQYSFLESWALPVECSVEWDIFFTIVLSRFLIIGVIYGWRVVTLSTNPSDMTSDADGSCFRCVFVTNPIIVGIFLPRRYYRTIQY